VVKNAFSLEVLIHGTGFHLSTSCRLRFLSIHPARHLLKISVGGNVIEIGDREIFDPQVHPDRQVNTTASKGVCTVFLYPQSFAGTA
jgi:hypothetical protein